MNDSHGCSGDMFCCIEITTNALFGDEISQSIQEKVPKDS
jgi:hypothetical protein